MNSELQLAFLGNIEVRQGGIPVTGFNSSKAQALLCYLAITGRPHLRPSLAGLLWGDLPETSARNNLRKALTHLRQLVGPHLSITRQEVAFNRDSPYWLDVEVFEVQVRGVPAETDVERLQAAVELYRGDFLEGFYVRQAPAFEEWAMARRAQLRELALQALHRLAVHHTRRGEAGHAEGIDYTTRLLALEPWREEAHRQLMLLLARSGRRSAALAQYETCRQVLAEELGVEPAAETTTLYDQIRAGTFQNTGQHYDTTSPLQAAGRSASQKPAATTVEFPLVGRDWEWQVVRSIWQALDCPHFICIGGEAGIGKTRLAEELLLLAESEDAPTARTRSHALQGQLAYGPITDWLRATPLQTALHRLDAVWLTEIARLLPELLVDRPALPQPQPLQANWQRQRFFDALLQAFSGVEGRLLLVLDDLQWCDTETLDWLQFLLERVEGSLLVVGTVRSDELEAEHPLHRVRQQLHYHDKLTELQLAPLSSTATTKLAAQVTGQTLTGDRAEYLFQDTAGNPLFVIESIRATPGETVTTSVVCHPEQTRNSHQLAMPLKMYRVIQSRLAQLSPETQTLAAVGAAIGRAFDVALLAQATNIEEEAVFLGLDELWQRRIIREVDPIRFDFSHDRIRDVTYSEIGPVKRRLLHHQVAKALEATHSENLDPVSGHLAVHCEAAGLFERAITFYQRAADEARRLFAHLEAIKYREQALNVLRELPGNRANRQTEIDLLLELSQDRTNAHGLGSPPVYPDLVAAYDLAQEVGTPVQQVEVLNALTGYDRVRGKWISSHELATKALAAAAKVDDPWLLAYTHFAMACTLIRRGYLEEAQAHFEQVQSFLPEDASRQNGGFLTRYGYCLWLLGFPEQALQQAASALRLRRKYEADKLPIPLHHYSSICLFCRDWSAVDKLSAELVELATKQNDDFSLRWGKIYRGWLLVQQGKLHDGIVLMRENADEHRARNNYFYECVWRSLLAEAYILAAALDTALIEIDSTLAYAQTSGDCHWNAQLLKLRGDCLQAGHAPDAEVERQYQLAIETARQQKGRSLELRATTSLCRLWQKQGKTAEAHQLLSDIYGWFTEGFDTGDLVEARALLAELQAQK